MIHTELPPDSSWHLPNNHGPGRQQAVALVARIELAGVDRIGLTMATVFIPTSGGRCTPKYPGCGSYCSRKIEKTWEHIITYIYIYIIYTYITPGFPVGNTLCCIKIIQNNINTVATSVAPGICLPEMALSRDDLAPSTGWLSSPSPSHHHWILGINYKV